MLKARIYLECDDSTCVAVFPSFGGLPAPLDEAFYTKRELRGEAKRAGWQRYGGKDYCPRCEHLYRSEALAEKGGK